MKKTLFMLVMHELAKKRDILTLIECMKIYENPPMSWKQIYREAFPNLKNWELPDFYFEPCQYSIVYSYNKIPELKIPIPKFSNNEAWIHWLKWVKASIKYAHDYCNIRWNISEEDSIKIFIRYFDYEYIAGARDELGWEEAEYDIIRDVLSLLVEEKFREGLYKELIYKSPPNSFIS